MRQASFQTVIINRFLILFENWTAAWQKKPKLKFSYVASKHKVKINVPKGGYVLITGDIPITLGFEQDTVIEKETTSPYVADVNGGFSSM